MPALGDLELAVMDVLWSRDQATSVREAHEALAEDRELAYTTVMTVLDRLAKKHLVQRVRDGRAWSYRPAQSRAELVAEQMHRLLTGSTDQRAGALSAFAGRLSPEERAAMVRSLDRPMPGE